MALQLGKNQFLYLNDVRIGSEVSHSLQRSISFLRKAGRSDAKEFEAREKEGTVNLIFIVDDNQNNNIETFLALAETKALGTFKIDGSPRLLPVINSRLPVINFQGFIQSYQQLADLGTAMRFQATILISGDIEVLGSGGFQAQATNIDEISVYSSVTGAFSYNLRNVSAGTTVSGNLTFSAPAESGGFEDGLYKQTIGSLISGTVYELTVGLSANPIRVITQFNFQGLAAGDQHLFSSAEGDFLTQTGINTYGLPKIMAHVDLDGTANDYSGNGNNAEVRNSPCIELGGNGQYLSVSTQISDVTFISVQIITSTAGSANLSECNLFRLSNSTDDFIRIHTDGTLRTNTYTGTTDVADGVLHTITITETTSLNYEVRVDGNLEFTMTPVSKYNLGLSGGVLFGRANTVANSIPSYDGKVFNLQIDGLEGSTPSKNKHYYPCANNVGTVVSNVYLNQDASITSEDGTESDATQNDFAFNQSKGAFKYPVYNSSNLTLQVNTDPNSKLTINSLEAVFSANTDTIVFRPLLDGLTLSQINEGYSVRVKFEITNYVSGVFRGAINNSSLLDFTASSLGVFEFTKIAGSFDANPVIFGCFSSSPFEGTVVLQEIEINTILPSALDANGDSTGLDVQGNTLPTGYGDRFFDIEESLEWQTGSAVTNTYANLPPPNVSNNEYGDEETTETPNSKRDLFYFPAGASAAHEAEILKLNALADDSAPKVIKRS